MSHAIHRVASFAIVAPYTLRVSFTDGSEQLIDFRAVLRGPLYGPLQDPQTFNRVSLDTEVGTLVWPNGADFDPTTLHDWPSVSDAFASLAATWVSTDNRRAG
jgi:hypothetical protein